MLPSVSRIGGNAAMANSELAVVSVRYFAAPGVHHELVLIDQSQLRQREREFYASHEQSLTRLPLELLNGRP